MYNLKPYLPKWMNKYIFKFYVRILLIYNGFQKKYLALIYNK